MPRVKLIAFVASGKISAHATQDLRNNCINALYGLHPYREKKYSGFRLPSSFRLVQMCFWKWEREMGFWKLGVAIAVSTLGLRGVVQAVPLNLAKGSPDIMAGFITTTYTVGGASNFTASGWALNIDYDGATPPDHDITGSMSYLITATIDNSGHATDATLKITGAIDDLSLPDQTLLTGTLAAFGYDSTYASPLEFVFNVTGGALASDFGSLAGVHLSPGSSSTFSGNFLHSFTNTGWDGVADTFRTPVPEPLTAVMGTLALAGSGLAALRRRSR
jgi:hypothetical protein